MPWEDLDISTPTENFVLISQVNVALTLTKKASLSRRQRLLQIYNYHGHGVLRHSLYPYKVTPTPKVHGILSKRGQILRSRGPAILLWDNVFIQDRMYRDIHEISQQYNCLNKTCIMKKTCQYGCGNFLRPPTLDEGNQWL